MEDALITGSIDLLLKEDKAKNINAAEVIDFKSMEVRINWKNMIGEKCHFKYSCIQGQPRKL